MTLAKLVESAQNSEIEMTGVWFQDRTNNHHVRLRWKEKENKGNMETTCISQKDVCVFILIFLQVFIPP